MAGRTIKDGKGIRPLAPGRYEFRAFANGVAISQTIHAPTDAAAKRQYRAWRAAVDDGRTRRGGATVRVMLDLWLAHKAPNLSPRSLELYTGVVRNHIAPSALGAKPIDRVTAADLDGLYKSLEKAGVSATTRRKVHVVLSGALGQAVTWDWLAVNPAARATTPRPPGPRTEDLTPSASEVATLLRAANDAGDHDFAALIHLAAGTGARRGELCGLRWDDLDLEGGSPTMAVRRAVIVVTAKGEKQRLLEGPTKSKKRRWVALGPGTVAEMRKHFDRCEARANEVGATMSKHAFVFSLRPGNTDGLHPDSVTEKFHRLAQSVGVEKSFHGLRHFHCSELIAAGEDIVTVSIRVGHAKPSITSDVYAHARPGRDGEVASRIDQIMDDAAAAV
jgi:integrase